MRKFVIVIISSLICCVAALFIFSPISPVAWKAPDIKLSAYSCDLTAPQHSLIAKPLIKNLPATTDGLAVTSGGRLFAGMRNGQIAEINPENGQWTIVAEQKGARFLGISAAADGTYIFAVDQASNSVLYFDLSSGQSPAKGQMLISHFNSKKLLWLNDVAHNDRYLYVSVTSRKRHNSKFRHELLEHKPNGFVLRYDRDTKELKELHQQLVTANGIVLEPETDTLIVAETASYHITRLDQKGQNSHQVIENLPGLPGNLTTSDRKGVKWLTLVAQRVERLDRLSERPIIRRLLPWLPESLQPKPSAFPCIMEIKSTDNNPKARAIVIKGDADMPTLATALEFDGYLYLSPYSSPTRPNTIDGRIFKVRLNK